MFVACFDQWRYTKRNQISLIIMEAGSPLLNTNRIYVGGGFFNGCSILKIKEVLCTILIKIEVYQFASLSI